MTSLAMTLALASCVAPKAPPPAVAPPPRPAPPPPAPPPVAWEDLPATPGMWSWSAGEARYGLAGTAPELVLRCAPAGMIVIERPRGGAAEGTPLVSVRTSDGSIAYGGQSLSSRMAVAATTRASDPFLDRIAYSRGHFSVAVSGRPLLVLPAWPEVSRVIDDCRSAGEG